MQVSIWWLIPGIICIIIVLAQVIWHIVENYIKTRFDIALYADMPMSMKNDAIYLNCINAKKHKEYWEAHESDLELYAMGMLMPTIFYKTPDVSGGYKISFTTILSNQQVLALSAAIKYNEFEMSHDGGQSRIKVNSINDKVAKRISANLQKATSTFDRKNREELIRKIKEAAKHSHDDFDDESKERIISHIDEDKSTPTTLVFQAIIPPNHAIYNLGFDPETAKFYYTYYGHLYDHNVRFVRKEGNLYEWEFYDLLPGRAYPGMSFSINGGQTVTPSTSLYGITKKENGKIPDLTEALLAKPAEGHIGIPMWTKEVAFGYMDKSLVKKTCDVIIKLHHEDEYPDEFLSIERVDPFYSKYEWIPIELDDFELDW